MIIISTAFHAVRDTRNGREKEDYTYISYRIRRLCHTHTQSHGRRLIISLFGRRDNTARVTQPRFIRRVLALNIVRFVVIFGSYVRRYISRAYIILYYGIYIYNAPSHNAPHFHRALCIYTLYCLSVCARVCVCVSLSSALQMRRNKIVGGNVFTM